MKATERFFSLSRVSPLQDYEMVVVVDVSFVWYR